ncbi:MAG: hypothetical protein R2811_02385 [Flavobacteriales bacterium]
MDRSERLHQHGAEPDGERGRHYNLTVTGANGCTSTASALVEQDSCSGRGCTGGTLTCAVTSIQLQGSGNGSFAWTGPNGFTSNEQNPR